MFERKNDGRCRHWKKCSIFKLPKSSKIRKDVCEYALWGWNCRKKGQEWWEKEFGAKPPFSGAPMISVQS